MGRLRLAFSASAKSFWLLVVFDLPGSRYRPRAPMLLDTGSGRTAISQAVALALGVDIDQLEMRDTRGVTAIAQRPRLPRVTLWVVGSQLARVRLPEVVVLTDLWQPHMPEPAAVRVRPPSPIPLPCLFGMDALEALGGRAVLDPRKGEGSIEW